jgi:hypothetical protein
MAMLHLLRGDFARGWRGYEARHRHLDQPRRSFLQPQWRGEPLHGDRILIHAEQGLGDVLHLLRYIPMVQAAGGTVLLELPKSLHRLAAELPGIAELLSPGDPLPSAAWHCPILSLPLAFQTTLETIPAPVSYLSVPAAARQAHSSRTWPSTGLRVALVWAGNPDNTVDIYRSLAGSLLAPLCTVPGIHLYSLQMGEKRHPAGLDDATAAHITDLTATIEDMADTAALIEPLDLVIAVDTAVAHLAAALGKPVWLLLPLAPDWRWLLHRSDSPWYPTMRLFRQPAFGDWTSVITSVRSALCDLSQQRT